MIEEIKELLKNATLEDLEAIRAAANEREVEIFQEGVELNDGSDTDVHTEHCCKNHWCKYSDSDCSVMTGAKKQSYKCFETSVCYDCKPGYWDESY